MSASDAGNPPRESPLSVARKWLPWCAALIFAMTAGWTALVAWAEVDGGKQQGVAAITIAVVSKAAPAAPLIVVYAIMIVSALDVAGGFAMVTARYLSNKFLEPLKEKRRAEGREEGREEERRKWTDWNRRRLEAETSGVPFDEPPPSS